MRRSPYAGDAPSREDLIRVYVEEGHSLKETGEILGGASTTLVRRWLRENEISIRTSGEGRARTAQRQMGNPDVQDAMREWAAEMRKRITPESYEKISAANRGRPAPNKGQPWSAEKREKIEALWQDPERRERFAEARRGEKNQHYKDGRSTGLNTWQWRQIKAQVYERDGWKCTECGRDCSPEAREREGHRVQCHHIKPRAFGGTHDLGNLRTLCQSCHAKLEWRTYGGFYDLSVLPAG